MTLKGICNNVEDTINALKGAQLESTFEPIIGSEIQCKELINYLKELFDVFQGVIYKWLIELCVYLKVNLLFLLLNNIKLLLLIC